MLPARREAIVLLAGLLVCGCVNPLPKGKSPLVSAQMSADGMVLELFFVRFPFGDKAVNDKLWQEIDEQQLEKEKFRLSIEKAKKDMAVAVLQEHVAEAELKAAAANIERRRLTAPLDAVVVELARHEGEWVQPGDTVMRLVRVDLLRVEGFLNAKDYQPSELQGQPVRVVVKLAHGQRETFPGKIVFVKPLVQAGGEFLVRAEVQNRQQDNFWVLSPGMSAEMTIQLK